MEERLPRKLAAILYADVAGYSRLTGQDEDATHRTLNYYGAFQRSSLLPVLRHIDRHLVKWVKWKYKKKRLYSKRARRWLGQVARYRPELFAHWRLGAPFPAE